MIESLPLELSLASNELQLLSCSNDGDSTPDMLIVSDASNELQLLSCSNSSYSKSLFRMHLAGQDRELYFIWNILTTCYHFAYT